LGSDLTPLHHLEAYLVVCCWCALWRLQVEGRGQGDALLAALSSGLQQFGVNVNSAAQQSEDGMVLNVFKVTTTDGKKVPKVRGPARQLVTCHITTHHC
jgi:hypothetical protein